MGRTRQPGKQPAFNLLVPGWKRSAISEATFLNILEGNSSDAGCGAPWMADGEGSELGRASRYGRISTALPAFEGGTVVTLPSRHRRDKGWAVSRPGWAGWSAVALPDAVGKSWANRGQIVGLGLGCGGLGIWRPD